MCEVLGRWRAMEIRSNGDWKMNDEETRNT